MKRFALLLVVLGLVLAMGAALGEGEFPALNDEGFYDGGEFIYESPETGVWRYCSDTLKVEIYRRTQEKPAQIWYEAEVWTTGADVFRLIPNDPEKPVALKSQEWPEVIAQNNHTVLALNSDYAQARLAKKNRVGIIIRNSIVYWEKTVARNKGTFPNLDTLALLPDGDMQVFWSDEKTAEEYLEMGAVDVLAFGPWLIRDGALNEEGLKKYGTSKAPRTAIGMVEKGHYFAMMMEGRRKEAVGGSVAFLAEKLLEKGCTVAFNLDGGATSTIMFMGKQLCYVNETKWNQGSARRTSEILGIGTSSSVGTAEEN